MEPEHFSHTSVLLFECIDNLNIRDGYTYVDCTTGGGGHSLEIAKRLGQHSRLICLDQDRQALQAAQARLSGYADRITFVHTNFSQLETVLEEYRIENLGGVLMDLGCSSYQFDTPERGFSYMHDAPLDMRMNQDLADKHALTAYQVVNTYSENDLRRIISDYGEERFAGRIAHMICNARVTAPIETTSALSDIIRSAIPKAARADGPHPAKRTFQAIRIEVNHELDVIGQAIESAVRKMVRSGRIAIISFHSLEDRIVKNTFATLSAGCECPPDFPVCICGKKPQIRIITKKPILPSASELEQNPRARSAKLRVAEKQ